MYTNIREDITPIIINKTVPMLGGTVDFSMTEKSNNRGHVIKVTKLTFTNSTNDSVVITDSWGYGRFSDDFIKMASCNDKTAVDKYCQDLIDVQLSNHLLYGDDYDL